MKLWSVPYGDWECNKDIMSEEEYDGYCARVELFDDYQFNHLCELMYSGAWCIGDAIDYAESNGGID